MAASIFRKRFVEVTNRGGRKTTVIVSLEIVSEGAGAADSADVFSSFKNAKSAASKWAKNARSAHREAVTRAFDEFEDALDDAFR